MKGLEMLEAIHKDNTYSKKTGSKRKPQRVSPSVWYNINQEPITDKDMELYLIQHKQMVEFLSKKGLLEDFKEFQKKKQLLAGEFAEWFKKWN